MKKAQYSTLFCRKSLEGVIIFANFVHREDENNNKITTFMSTRREFLKGVSLATAGMTLTPGSVFAMTSKETRQAKSEKVKIAYSTLRPGSSSGYHVHEQNSEIIFVISGTATFHYDDTVEEVRAGQCHYCPMGHSHYMENLTDHDLVYFAVVPEHH